MQPGRLFNGLIADHIELCDIEIMASIIENITARQILDSRGNPTVEVTVELPFGVKGIASVPSGASKGLYEALELRDGDKSKFDGKGVLKAVQNVNKKIAPELTGKNALCQNTIDSIITQLDNSDNKFNLGANAILGVSLAAAQAAAASYQMPLYRYLGGVNAVTLPVPMMNILNGGVHADNNLDFQEFMIAPAGAENFEHSLQIGVEIFYKLKEILRNKNLTTSVGDEGGFAPQLKSNSEAVELILEAVSRANYSTDDVKICLDAASSEFYNNGKYKFENKSRTAEEMVEIFADWTEKYPIISIEDGMAQEDIEGWKLLTEKLGGKCQLVGDDLFVTNPKRFANGIKKCIANAILIKPNQIGTLSETLETIRLAQLSGYGVIISHRSGETESTFIADLSVAVNSGQIKTGSLSRSERVAKYNRLIRIEQELGSAAKYLGLNAFKGQKNACDRN